MKYKQDTKQKSRKGRNYNDKQKRKELYQNVFSLNLGGRTRGNFILNPYIISPVLRSVLLKKNFLFVGFFRESRERNSNFDAFIG